MKKIVGMVLIFLVLGSGAPLFAFSIVKKIQQTSSNLWQSIKQSPKKLKIHWECRPSNPASYCSQTEKTESKKFFKIIGITSATVAAFIALLATAGIVALRTEVFAAQKTAEQSPEAVDESLQTTQSNTSSEPIPPAPPAPPVSSSTPSSSTSKGFTEDLIEHKQKLELKWAKEKALMAEAEQLEKAIKAEQEQIEPLQTEYNTARTKVETLGTQAINLSDTVLPALREKIINTQKIIQDLVYVERMIYDESKIDPNSDTGQKLRMLREAQALFANMTNEFSMKEQELKILQRELSQWWQTRQSLEQKLTSLLSNAQSSLKIARLREIASELETLRGQ